MNEERMDRRVRKTRLAIQQAFLSLMKEKGLQAVTVGDITARADINRATFYAHYRDKQDLISQAIAEVLDEWVQEEEARLSGEASAFDFERLLPIFVRMFENIAKHAEFYRVMLGPDGYPGFAERLGALMQRLIKEGHSSVLRLSGAQPLVEPDIYLSYVTSAQLGVITYWLKEGARYSPEYMAGQLMLLYRLGAVQAADYSG
ncbi:MULTISPECIES: TetR/AcrR family transcriptional regulator [Paenibacillus]|uniref:TetR/AcrR family transcriptional regulator n=1 Tax=Paenibacillus TaxID=44249 RepID=UPI0022B922EA|nr:TetR/AcrR family transcriptional regulator [Paenibacillus caseinilyticus]MCZ8518364.1 TetR/AcrR family transcriptional regulator [Paenibacillus caseinilyticus]